MNLHLTVGSSEMWVATAKRHNAEHSNLITNPGSTQLLRRKLLCTYSESFRQRCPKRKLGAYSSDQHDEGSVPLFCRNTTYLQNSHCIPLNTIHRIKNYFTWKLQNVI